MYRNLLTIILLPMIDNTSINAMIVLNLAPSLRCNIAMQSLSPLEQELTATRKAMHTRTVNAVGNDRIACVGNRSIGKGTALREHTQAR